MWTRVIKDVVGESGLVDHSVPSVEGELAGDESGAGAASSDMATDTPAQFRRDQMDMLPAGRIIAIGCLTKPGAVQALANGGEFTLNRVRESLGLVADEADCAGSSSREFKVRTGTSVVIAVSGNS